MLHLRLSTRAGRVEISSDDDRRQVLQQLRTRFASATTLTPTSFELGLDDLLVNLDELVIWPADDRDVRWDRDLLTLVEGNARDAEMLRVGLEAGGPANGAAIHGEPNFHLTEFQSRDLTALLRLSHGANFSVPGAGKTRVALSIFAARRANGEISQMLVVCPKSAFETWQDEASVCFPSGNVRVAIMDSAHVPPAEIVLINYERLPDSVPTLVAWLRARSALLVLDEAHRMKLGPAGAWGSASLTLAPFASRRLVLTGTPAPNGARDLENIFAFVWPGQGRRVVNRALAGASLRDASKVLRPFFVRTTKNELGLPPMDIRVRRVELPPLHRELYNALLGQFARRWTQSDHDLEALGRVVLYLLMAATSPALLATGSSRYEPLAYQVPPVEPPRNSTLAELMRDLPDYELSPKYQEALRLTADNVDAGRKTLIWSTFIRSLKSLESLLGQFAPAVIHGATEDREAELRRFRSDPDCYVLLSNPATLGEGVSLHHACHDAIYIDRDFAAGRFLQSLDRIHRLGLAHDAQTTVTVLLATDTIDELVQRRLAIKLQFLGAILDDPAVVELGDLSEEPAVGAGMDPGDIAELMGYLTPHGAPA